MRWPSGIWHQRASAVVLRSISVFHSFFHTPFNLHRFDLYPVLTELPPDLANKFQRLRAITVHAYAVCLDIDVMPADGFDPAFLDHADDAPDSNIRVRDHRAFFAS